MGIYRFDNSIIDPSTYPWGTYDWTPANITTALWLDAKDKSTLLLDSSGNVEQWNDKSGNARHASQTTTAYRPFYNHAQGAVEFTEASLHHLTLASKPFSGTTPRTVFAVVSHKKYGTVGNSYFSATSYGYGLGTLWDLSAESDGIYIRISGNDCFTPTATLNEAVLITCQWESGSSSNSSVWLNSAGLTRAGGSSQTVNTHSSGTAMIGRAVEQSNSYFEGYICEIIVIAEVLSVENHQKINNYISAKWGLF